MTVLEFMLSPADLPQLARWRGMRAGRSSPATIAWYDTEDGALAKSGRCLAATGRHWRLATLHPETAIAPPPTLIETGSTAHLPADMPADLIPCARFTGSRRTLRWSDGEQMVVLQVLDGRVEGMGQRRDTPGVCRVTLDGPDATLSTVAIALAGDMALTVPQWGFAEQALAAARGETPPPRALGAPQVSAGDVTESLVRIAGHLLDVMLYWAARVPSARTPEPVHQMRVATRRLRSALSIYRSVAPCPELAGLAVTLKACADRLGTARDWDVFIDGLGARLAAAFPDDRRCRTMLRAAGRRRRDAYAGLRLFLAGPDFRRMTVALACAATLRPWETAADPSAATAGGTATDTAAAALRQNSAIFAATVLAKRMKRVRRAGRAIDTLTVPALHELRKDCKRLRYAAEFFAPLHGARKTRRFLTRLSDLQEELGLLNDGAAVSGLMAQLGRLERGYAAGLVEGFSAASAGPARDRIAQTWKRFKAVDVFW